MNNGLEKCEEYQRETNDRNQEDEDYERYKCKHLRGWDVSFVLTYDTLFSSRYDF